MQVNADVRESKSKQELEPQAQRDRIIAWCQQHWTTMLAYVTGSVDENLLLRIEYLDG